MNYYFAPVIPNVETHVTLVNYPPVGGAAASDSDCFAYATWPDGDVWRVHHLGSLKSGETRTFTPHDVAAYQKENGILLFFFDQEKLSETLPELPIKPTMRSAPNWRGNIQFRSKTTAVSFQGEYPDQMLPIPKGSLSSICPLIQSGDGVQTTLLLINVNQKPQIESKTLVLGHLRSKKVLAQLDVLSNSCNLIHLQDFERDLTDPLGVFSPNMVGVPLYLSYDAGYQHMSLEHSHPPIELCVFGDPSARYGLVGQMKTFWLEQMCPNTQ